MRLTYILPLAALTTAFVIPDEQVMSQIAIKTDRQSDSILEKLPSKDQLVTEFENTFSRVVQSSKNAFDEAVEVATEAGNKVGRKIEETAFDSKAWLDTTVDNLDAFGHHDHHGHHGHHGHHRHSHKPNMTVYQLIAESKYTTKLAKLISEYDDLVQLLNGTAANFTVFAPIDSAFEKVPDDAPKPSKELLKKVLAYHCSADFYPAGRVLVTHTIPTLLRGEELGGEPQRLSTNIGLRGLTVNFYSRIVAVNIVRLAGSFPISQSTH